MNNLKRILSLALASVMVMGMMVTGASAAKFDDNEDIDYTAAVDVMAALGIINGYAEDNTFRPNGDVTRAQMAKMITVIKYGYEPDLGTPDHATFADSATHWALPFIEYCHNTGIIAGRSDTEFDPEGKVTADEAAKMILVALGFDAEVFGLTGTNWSKNTMTLASNLNVIREDGEEGAGVKTAEPLNLFDELNVTAKTQLTRDQAAQLIYNGIQSQTVKMALTGVTGGTNTGILGGASGQTPTYSWSLTGPSLMESNFSAHYDEKVMSQALYHKATSKTDTTYWQYTIGGEPYRFGTNDVSNLYQQKVRVVYRKHPVTGNITTLSITPVANDVVKTTAKGNLAIDEENDTIDGYKLATGRTITNFPVYEMVNGVLATSLKAANFTNLNVYDKVQLIDNNGDSKLDCLVVTKVSVDTVRSTSADAVNLTNTGKIALKGNTVAAGLAKGDYVAVSQNAQTKAYTVEATETKIGTVDAVRNTTENPNQIRVDGIWYTAVTGAAYTEIAKLLGNECELVMINDMIYDGDTVDENVVKSDAVMAVKQANELTKINGDIDTNSSHYLQVRILKSDNTTEVLKVVNIRANAADEEGVELNGNTEDVESLVALGQLYTYELDTQGYATLVPYAAPEGTLVLTLASGDESDDKIEEGVAEGTPGGDNQPTSHRFAEDATIFVYVAPVPASGTPGQSGYSPYKAEQYKALKGSEVNAWGKHAYTPDGTLYGAKAANGFTYASLGALTMDSIPGAGADTATFYGILTEDARRVYDSSAKKSFVEAILWNGSDNTTIKANGVASATGAVLTGFVKGAVVTYTVKGNGDIDLALIGSVATPEAVEAYDGLSTVKFVNDPSGKEYDISKATICYVDTEDCVGATGNTIPLADPINPEDVDEGYYKNVWVVKNDQGAVVAIVVEVNGDTGDEPAGVHDGVSQGTVTSKGIEATPLDEMVDGTATLTKNAEKKITGRFNDWIADTDSSKLYTFGIFQSDIHDNVSDEWYLFTVELGAGKWKVVRTSSDDATLNYGADDEPFTLSSADTLTMLCGNKMNATFTITKVGTPASGTEGEDDYVPAVPDTTYTFTWTKD